MGRRSGNYPPELRERAVRMVAGVRPEYPSDWPAICAVAEKLEGDGLAAARFAADEHVALSQGDLDPAAQYVTSEVHWLPEGTQPQRQARHQEQSADGVGWPPHVGE